MAAGLGLPFSRSQLKGTDEVKYNPHQKLPTFWDEDIYAVRPIVPDVVLLHAAESDFRQYQELWRFRSVDQLLAKAGRRSL